MIRLYDLDKYRGFTIVSMVLFHLCYDINLYNNLLWYNNFFINRIWQLSIALSFYLISGISSNFLQANENIKRGIKTSILGFIISLITYIFIRNQLIIFGVLNGLGFSMIITGLIKKYKKLNKNLFWIFIILFVLTYSIPSKKFLGHDMNSFLYDMNLFFLGFPKDSFYSTDYFPIIPWIFIYISGYLLGQIIISKKLYNENSKINLLAKIGQKSMTIYLLHQPILFLLVYITFKIF